MNGNETIAIAPFHLEEFPPGHGPTKFSKWYEASELYKVEYEYKFEPYFVIKKYHDLPPFWEKFHGRYSNKYSWVGELSLAGYSFYVDPSCFLIHVNHNYDYYDDEIDDHWQRMPIEFEERFKLDHLLQTYGTSV